MNRICDGADDYSQDEHGMPCRCGRRYDDVDRRTVWPHEIVGGGAVVVDGAGATVLTPSGVTKVTLGSPEATALLARVVAQLRGEVNR